MLRFCFCVSIALILFLSCKKNDYSAQAVFYGTWVNSQPPHDTIQFFYRDSRNVMWYNPSFTTNIHDYTETLFDIQNNKLLVARGGLNDTLRIVNSFTWTTQGKSFNVLGAELYNTVKDSAGVFMYTKVK